MNSDLKGEHILSLIREQLNKQKIHLWLEPYFHTNVGVGDEQEQALQLLCQKFSEELNIEHGQCMSALRDLQNHSLDRLKSNAVFKETGVACLKVKVSGEFPRTLTVNILLADSASALIEEISNKIGIPSERVKVISHGRVLKPPESLVSQGVKNGMQLMAVILTGDERLQSEEKRLKTLETTKKDVQLLAGRSNMENEYYLQVENQSGETLNLPYHERKSLVTAMTLHEKGRVALKKEDYPLALILLLEADKEYSDCTSELLDASDNYALLHLDVAWCYLCLRNPAQIPDADKRLRLCEQNFHKSYGPNLERLMALKGTTGNESALFMRLHLLQGVVRFHQNMIAEAKKLFERAQAELSGLKVDDDKLCLLMELGFTSAEARLGLRATHGNIEATEELIYRKRKEKDLARERNRLKLINERERIKLGMCADGRQTVEPQFLKQLVGMGFDHQRSLQALKLANNVMSEAITLIQDQPHLLPCCSSSVSEDSVAKVASFGLPPEMARETLERYPDFANNVRSLCNLTSAGSASSSEAVAASASALSFLEGIKNKRKAQEEREHKAFARVSEDLLDSDLTEDHLDLNLAQEEQFLMEYLSLLN